MVIVIVDVVVVVMVGIVDVVVVVVEKMEKKVLKSSFPALQLGILSITLSILRI